GHFSAVFSLRAISALWFLARPCAQEIVRLCAQTFSPPDPAASRHRRLAGVALSPAQRSDQVLGCKIRLRKKGHNESSKSSYWALSKARVRERISRYNCGLKASLWRLSLFGGYGFDSMGNISVLNDFWKFSCGQWTSESGSALVNQRGSMARKTIPPPQ